MASTTRRAFKQAIASGCFDPVYLLSGEELYLRDEAIETLIVSAVEESLRAFNVDILSSSALTVSDLEAYLQTPPVGGSRRVVVISDAGTLRPGMLAILSRYVASPAPDVVLVLGTTDSGGGKLRGVFEKGVTAVEFNALSPAETVKWVEWYVTKKLGSSITPQACSLVQAILGNDLRQLANELTKAESYVQGGTIDEAAVTAVVGLQEDQTIGHLLDAVAVRNGARALALLPRVMSQGKMSAVAIVMALTVQMLAMGLGRALLAQRVAASGIRQAMMQLLRESRGVLTGRPWGDAVQAWQAASEAWSMHEIEAAVTTLGAVDLTLKESRVSLDEELLRGLILSMCCKGMLM